MRYLGLAIGPFLCSWAMGVHAQVDVMGTVRTKAGAPISGATVVLRETGLSTVTDAAGAFHLRNVVGVFRPGLVTPQGLRVAAQGMSLRLENPGPAAMSVAWLRENGKADFKARVPPRSARVFDLAPFSPATGMRILVITSGKARIAYPLLVNRGRLSAYFGAPAPRATALARAAADSFPRLTLEFAAAGYLTKRWRMRAWTYPDSIRITMLPTSATLRERILDFVGDTLNLRLAWLRVPLAQTRYQLYHADLAEMVQDTFPIHTYANSLGAMLPSWSPDGRFLAYETGREGQTQNGGGYVSRIFFQTLSGARSNGPVFPATNPRFWGRGPDTMLVWCSSGNDNGWSDTSGTYAQRFSGGVLSGAPRRIANGSYNGGLSRDSNWLAGGSPRGVLLNRGAGTRTFFHVYPGSPVPLVDSVQVCNMSIAPDTSFPLAMFVDFGVFDSPGYPNIAMPKIYGQHQVILIADASSTAPGRIVDFINTPAAELAQSKTWDDPEWSNHPDFATASTRGLDGGGNLVQPDVYLIKVSTLEVLKLATGAGYFMPVAWIGR